MSDEFTEIPGPNELALRTLMTSEQAEALLGLSNEVIEAPLRLKFINIVVKLMGMGFPFLEAASIHTMLVMQYANEE